MKSETTTSDPQEGSSHGGQKGRHGRTCGPARRSTKGQWTMEEDDILRKAVEQFNGKNWKKIAECFKDRTDVQCLHRWQKVLNPELVKGPWSKEEDEIIIELVNKYGPKKWSTISQHLPGRIGKQCSERWHNHLNPAINKEAWSQEEELTLIRAHQIYGNKWAELTKFLPGRSDNAIKNHWNSSVKKKLDSYLASGLLDQFQSLPLAAPQNMSIPSSSSLVKSSGDKGGVIPGVDAEESECSQGSTIFGCLQSTNDLPDEVKPVNEELYFPEMPCGIEQQISTSTSCAEPHYPTFEDVMFIVPEISCEAEYSTKFSNPNCSHEIETSTAMEFQLNLHGVPKDTKQELCQDSSLLTHCMDVDGKDEVTGTVQTSVELRAPPSIPSLDKGSPPQSQVLITDEECCRVLFPDTVKDECTSSGASEQGPSVVSSQEKKGSFCHLSSETQAHETGKISALSCHPSSLDVMESRQHVALLLPADKDLDLDCKAPDQGYYLLGAKESEHKTDTDADFIYLEGPENSHGNGDYNGNSDPHDLSYIPKDTLKLVPVNSFSSPPPPRVNRIFFPINNKPDDKDTGALCYEPPRFPSAEIPFFSCDLAPSSSDLQQEYSPFGIRQLMVSSMNCMAPFRLWDSPSRDGTNDTAKFFNGPPSILKKKRQRDLLSPLLDRRKDKKLVRDVAFSLAKDFSRLDVMLDRRDDCTSESPCNRNAPYEGKESRACGTGGLAQESVVSDVKDLKETSDSQNKAEGVTSTTNAEAWNGGNASVQNDLENSGILVEHNNNDHQEFSPNQNGTKADKNTMSNTKTPINRYKNSLGTPRRGNPSEPPRPAESVPSSATKGNKTDVAENGSFENLGIFNGTPFRKSLESPSAWKSPMFFSSFFSSPTFPTEMTIEDIGCLMSPGGRSYDALGLMKHLSEHTAATYADALEVLGNDTPETILKKRQLRKSNHGKENQYHPHDDQLENHSHTAASTVTVERRTLDFSDCGTPGKAKASSSVSASPSSFLLKSCR
ncbi:PREDICTED: myb-related protein 3R-1-like isoform X2 [Tarenaya hassleriana]|uniref:myb-related protein 3R-1-like isoform X2 n=1 Tax=Tarenaya hassleriana TaxID=28532 RepID=UPI00053C4D30|nr:PREDICTED: myb-related protein 3R-1-like isoform X2 [Tarenaya hassleriana]